MGKPSAWPTDKLNALRLGRRLVVEVPASGAGRRAFVDISPVAVPEDAEAHRQGWKRADRDRVFRLKHWDYDGAQIDGWDYDLGAVLVREATAGGEAELIAVLEAWELLPEQFLYPWETDDPA
ncbi:hypothetical protein SMC26_12120 [Actinomadura fulvescens]|uniref:Uncharacterized protein n=1 Tax=Actinomadura fulvescens TaxID=46160 RepID=A0ABP6BQ60_9ACTN